jgi:uncharacterized membrane protein
MEWDETFPFFLLALLAAVVMAVKRRRDMREMRARLAGLAETVRTLDQRVSRLAEQFAARRADEPPIEDAVSIAPVSAPEPIAAVEQQLPLAASSTDAPPAPVPAAVSAAAAVNWEQILVENWLVWLGGATLALGGAFLVKLSIDYGLLTPAVRVALGVLLGVALSAGAEWVRRRETPANGEGAPSYVPQALAAAGAATIFAAVYAAHQLYGLLPASIAFVLLAITAGGAVAQALQYGPLVAALGLVGAYAVPLLVASDAPHALPLFAYLTIVTAGSLAVLRHRAWWWLVWFSLAGATLWVPLWFAGSAGNPETPVVAAYLLVLLALFVAFRHGVPRVGFLTGMADTMLVRVALRAALWAIAACLLLTAHVDHFAATSTTAATIAIAVMLALAYRDAALDDLIAASGALALTLLMTWNLPPPAPELNLEVFRLKPDHVANFTTAAILYTVLLGGGAFAVLPRVRRPGRWAALSAAAPLAILIVAYWRLQQFEIAFAWTLAALALAGLELGGAFAVAKRRTKEANPEIEAALAAYAVGVLGSTITAAAFALGEAWLTVALAAHLPAIGWVESRIRVAALRWVALAIASAVLVRLVMNPYVLDYPLGTTPILNWLLYGYGVPAAAFIVATRQFGSSRDDALVRVLEAGSIIFSLLLLSLELIHALYGRLTMDWLDSFASGAALTALWLAFAAAVIALGEYRQRPVLRWGGRLLLAIATVFSVLWQLLGLLFGVPVGDLPVLNALLLADAIPALVYGILAWLVPTRPILRTIARVLAAGYAFLWVTLEIQHAFHAKIELFAGSTDVEWYLYSVAWLAFAGAALAAGLVRGNQWLRRAGLIGVGVVVGKVFLSDMAELSGVLRALSFIGLGGALVGLGYAYRHFRPFRQIEDPSAPAT